MGTSIGRRRFLGGMAAAGLAATAPAVTGCGGGKSNNSLKNNTKVKLPTYVPYQGVKPDLPGNAAGALPGYIRFPAKPAPAKLTAPVAKGDSVRALLLTYTPPPPAEGSNAFWQSINKQLGVDLKLTLVPQHDYQDKLPTVIAGEIPDLVQVPPSNYPDDFPQLLASKFADLSEFLGGDAIKDYPYLANLPTASWQTCVFNGGIYGLPVPRGGLQGVMFARMDIIEQKQLNPAPKSFAEFTELCVGLTDLRHSKWALGSFDTTLTFIQQSLGLPFAWKEENGKFTHVWEMEEFKKAFDAVLALKKKNVINPDGIDVATTQTKTWFDGGSIALNWDGATGWNTYVQNTEAKDPQTAVGGLVTPGYDGGDVPIWHSSPIFSITAVKKASKSRIKQILAMCNWLAAPFGTEEYEVRKYGVKGTDYTLQGTDPVLTDKGIAEAGLSLLYITDSPWLLYDPGQPTSTKNQHDVCMKCSDRFVNNPADGLFSNTNTTKGGVLQKQSTDAQDAIFAGRDKISDWDDFVAAWRKGGGDQMRREYQQAYAQLH